MSTEPTPNVLAALRVAASQTNVPLSLLWGVAFAESSFDPTKIGPMTSSGEQARGLMQLMPKVAEANGVSDPMDAMQSALGGARVLAKLGRALGWNVPNMLAAYVWGPARYAQAKLAGKAPPAEVMTYVRRALAARDVYRNKADRPSGSLMQAIDSAIEMLAALNPAYAPAVTVRGSWGPFFAAHGGDSDAAAVLSADLKRHWKGYALAYERAPITDESTPVPRLIEPDFWAAAAATVDRAKTAVADVAERTVLGVGGGLFLLALFWFAVSDKRRGG